MELTYQVAKHPEKNQHYPFTFKTRYTILLGWNGAGKSTVMHNLKAQIPTMFFAANDTDVAKHKPGGAVNFDIYDLAAKFQSEGEQLMSSFGRIVQSFGHFVRQQEPGAELVFAADQLDSGWSYDRIRDAVKFLTSDYFQRDVKYVLLSANSFEFVHLFLKRDDVTFIWVPTMKEIQLTTFEEFVKLYKKAPR